ncbi:MAG TPA: Swt1 family HEPN domain-containing protein [Gemmatimonadaceae bacterium]|nr:Swt1 family HEPN domain-containing protein [Gemmatimonadaceae bacterium]
MVDGALYEFAFRALLTEEALDRAGRIHPNLVDVADVSLAERLGTDALDEALVANARQMAVVFVVIVAFESGVRRFISNVLLEKIGADWWDKCATQSIKRKVESRQKDEELIRWHSPRGVAPILYTDMGDLASLIRQSWPHFEAHVPSIEWASSILDIVERSRNVIMHSGVLGREDIERVGINVRDWIRQVGS